MKVGVKKLNDKANLPTYADPGASGFDFYATEQVVIKPFRTGIVPTGLAFEIPEGYEIQVRGRSGLAFVQNILAHFGTVDESYKGEVKIKLFNFSFRKRMINVGDRVAQGVLAEVAKAQFEEIEELSTSNRGGGGFGHTGK